MSPGPGTALGFGVGSPNRTPQEAHSLAGAGRTWTDNLDTRRQVVSGGARRGSPTCVRGSPGRDRPADEGWTWEIYLRSLEVERRSGGSHFVRKGLLAPAVWVWMGEVRSFFQGSEVFSAKA